VVFIFCPFRADDCEFVDTVLSTHQNIDMAEFESDHDDADLPDFADRDAVIRFSERNDMTLPDGLTSEKIKSRGCW